MPNTRKPRSGSLQYWPRKRAKRTTARIRSWANVKDVKPIGFAGYKVGMTHMTFTDKRKIGKTKVTSRTIPITVIECPPLKIASIRFYVKNFISVTPSGEIFADNLDKELGRAIKIPKSKKKLDDFKPEDLHDIRLVVYTQPKLTGIGKKKPELFEMALGGNINDKFEYAKNNLGKEINLTDIFQGGDQVDVHAITKGKGYQGPVKRFGISIRARKSEKTIRGPGSLGPWKGQTNLMWKVAFAGQTGYHQRTEFNKWLVKIGDNPEEINQKGGFIRYGVVKNNYILLKGSIAGPSKRLIRFNTATRPSRKIPKQAPLIEFISVSSKQ